MSQERETPKFSGIADPKCRCTPDRLCRRCQPHSPGPYASIVDQTLPERFRGKFREPWNDAVKKNNLEVKNGGER
jgi:hypothetical protein